MKNIKPLCIALSAFVISAIPAWLSAGTIDNAGADRGSTVFKTYCVRCHGERADGNGRFAKLYTPKPANLVENEKTAEYMELVIRNGGGKMGQSQFMPPWGDELSGNQIKDVIQYILRLRNNDPARK